MFDHLAARIAYNAGITLQVQGFHNESQEYLKRAYEFFEHTEHVYEIAATLVARGISYKNLHEHKLAYESFTNAVGLFYSLNLLQETCDAKVTLASVVTAKENPVLAIEQLADCIPVYEERNCYTDLILVHSKIARIRIESEEYDTAFTSLSLAAQIIEEQQVEACPSVGVCYQIFARYYFGVQDFDQAVQYAFKSAAVFDTIGLVADQVNSLRIACDSYHRLGDDTQAFKTERKCCDILQQLHGRGTFE